MEENKHAVDFIPENEYEEFAIVVGNLDSLARFMNNTDSDVIRKSDVRAILGIGEWEGKYR